ncbi:MAG: phasin family protein [Pseudomonadota bacterium]
MDNKQMFEFPSDMRDMAEQNVAQARVAYGQFMEFMSQAMNAWSASGIPEAKNFKTLQERAVGFAKDNAERSFELASDLAKAKDFQEVMTLQSRYVQTQMQTFGIQAQQLSWLMADALQNMQSGRDKS